MERKIGEIFSYKGQKYIVQKVEVPDCELCNMRFRQLDICQKLVGECLGIRRSDNTNVIAARLG